MKIVKGNSKVVYQGDCFEELGWGPVQFPKFFTLTDGRIGIFIHNEDDAPHALGEGIFMVSNDCAKTFDFATESDVEKFGDIILNDGSSLRIVPEKAKKVQGVKEGETHFGGYQIPTDDYIAKNSNDETQFPSPFNMELDIFGSRNNVYFIDSLPTNLIKRTFSFSKYNPKTCKKELFESNVEWDYRTVSTYNPNVVYGTGTDELFINPMGLYTCRVIKRAPDGALWIAHYRGLGTNPKTGAYYGKGTAYFLKSTDEGKTWVCKGHIPYLPDETYEKNDIYAYIRGGFYEPTMEIYEDGSMMCILRTCNVFTGTPEWGPTYISYSYDDGESWTKPVYFREKGALPVTVKLDCGVTLAVITRPGIDVYASSDNGKTFPEKLEIMTAEDRSGLSESKPERPNFWMWAGSCCNCSIIATGKNTALLAYSDFYINDNSGKPKKSIVVTELIIEE